MNVSALNLALCALLAGCASCPESVRYVDRVEYVTREAPAELFQVPPAVEPLNVDTATQRDVAEWLLKKEARSRELESMITRIREFYGRPLESSDSKK